MKTFKLRCEILSPLHIGRGDQIDPLNYIIKAERLYRLSFEQYVKHMNDDERAKFEDLIDKADLARLRKYTAENINIKRDTIYSIEVSPQIASLYRAKIDDIQNQLLINSFIRTKGLTKPLMPGSSIKGAIRTAVVSGFAKKSKLPRQGGVKEEYEFESRLLGYRDVKADPFRGIKIRDKILPYDSTIIREVKNVSNKKERSLKSNSIQIFCEVSHSVITGKAFDFETEISFDEALFSTRFLSKTLDENMIVISCQEFYRNKMEDEHKKFYKNSESESCSSQLLDITFDENSFPLRIGRFSGVESVTLDNYRNPRPPGNKAVWGTTRNLAEGVYPMGWVKAIIYKA